MKTTTITIPQKEYRTLKQKAVLYDTVVLAVPREAFAIETYSEKRVKEFLREDKLPQKTTVQVKKLLKRLKS